MKLKYFFLLLTITSLSHLFGQQNDTYDDLIDKAFDYYSGKNYELSVLNYEKAFKIIDKNSDDLYNAACAASLNNELKKASTFLKSAIDNGWTNADHLQEDKDLEKLHSLRSWKKIVKKATQKEKESKLDNYQVSDDINDLIIANKGKSIYKLATDNFKSKTKSTDLKNTVNLLHNLLDENNIDSMDDIKTSSSSSTSYTNGIESKNATFKYKIIPNYFNKRFKTLFKPIGYQIKIGLSKENGQWLLSIFDVDNQYATPDYKMNVTIDSFLQKTDSLIYKYTIEKDKKTSVKNRTIKSSLIKNEVMNELQNLKYIEFSELTNMPINKEPKNTHSLSFYSNNNNSSLFDKKTDMIKSIKIIFYDNPSNLIFITNGIKYAAYKATSLEAFKELGEQIIILEE